MKHVTKIQFRKDGKLHSITADVNTSDLELFRKECREHYDTDLVYFIYEDMPG